jgi:dienelactone hydrolase
MISSASQALISCPQQSPSFDLKAWFAKHGSEQTRPSLDKVIAALKGEGVTKFGATGYCFGGTSPHSSTFFSA